jgi:DNA end-binding protein Ku
VIRETIRSIDKVAIGRVVLTSREPIIGLGPLKNWIDGNATPYEVCSEDFDAIQDVNVTKDMLDLAKHTVNQK